MSRIHNKHRLTLRTRSIAGTALALLLTSVAVVTRSPDSDGIADNELGAPGSVHGILRVSVHADTNEKGLRATHSFVYRRGRDYDGVEDSELRGYMDGGVKYAFNQAHQVHLRIGRRGTGVRHGEHELKRVLMLWQDISVPADARVEAASLEFTIEVGAPAAFSLYLYAVQKDWGPGFGGVAGNNQDAPLSGSVWWRDAKHDERAWALPGCSFASDDHPDADTSAQPIASARYRPGDSKLVFEGPGLADYVADQAAAGLPLSVLVKAGDAAEDVPGRFRLTVYSSEIDDNRITNSRPALSIRWSAASTRVTEMRLMLEHGRRYLSPWFPSGPSAMIAASLLAGEESEPCRIEIRGKRGRDTTPWKSAAHPLRGSWDFAQVRVTAATDPIALGDSFRESLHKTWVTAGAPESQPVTCTLISPSGHRHELTASYDGRFNWIAEFPIDELGRWSYTWSHSLESTRYDSPRGVFDVLADDPAPLAVAARTLIEELRSRNNRARPTLGQRTRFARIQRAYVQMQSPESFRSPAFAKIDRLINEMRSALGAEQVPLYDVPTTE